MKELAKKYSTRAGIALALAAGPMVSTRVLGQTVYSWASPTAGGTWSVPTNWSPNGVPTTTDTAKLLNATANRTIFYDTGSSGAR